LVHALAPVAQASQVAFEPVPYVKYPVVLQSL